VINASVQKIFNQFFGSQGEKLDLEFWTVTHSIDAFVSAGNFVTSSKLIWSTTWQTRVTGLASRMSFLIYGKLITLILAVEAPFLILGKYSELDEASVEMCVVVVFWPVDLGAGGMTKRDDDTFAKEKDQGHQIPVQSTTACSQDSLFSVDGLAWDAPTATVMSWPFT
jgi:hypothetical protein